MKSNQNGSLISNVGQKIQAKNESSNTIKHNGNLS